MRLSELQDPVQRLLRALKRATPWKRFPRLVRDWTPEQVRERSPALELRIEGTGEPHPDPIEQTWFCYGCDAMAAWCPSWPGARGWFVPGARTDRKEAVDRILGLRATVQPSQRIVTDLEDAWRARLTARDDQRPECIVRNEWAERSATVATIRSEAGPLTELAIRLVEESGGDSRTVVALLEDPYFHEDLLDQAVATLNSVQTVSGPSHRNRDPLQERAMEAELGQIRREHELNDQFRKSMEETRDRVIENRRFRDAVVKLAETIPQLADTASNGPGYRVDGKGAAKLIGVTPETLSRWRTKTPAWASGDARHFTHLIETNADGFYRDRIVRVRCWYEAALKNGVQKPTACP